MNQHDFINHDAFEANRIQSHQDTQDEERGCRFAFFTGILFLFLLSLFLILRAYGII